MSAPAPALAKVPSRTTVTVRLADAAFTVACLSLVFGFLLVFFPVLFARIIQDRWLMATSQSPLWQLRYRSTHAFTSVSPIGWRPSHSSRGGVLRVPADCGRFGTKLLSSRCRRLHPFGRPAESARSCRRGNTRPYLPGIGFRNFSAFPCSPPSATTQSRTFESRN